MMNQAVIYTRVSTERQANEGVSLDAQLDRARAYCAANGLEVIGEFCDAGISGKSMKNRPEFAKALGLVCRRKAVLVFYSLSRISRSTRDLMDISEKVRVAGAGLASLQEQIDTTTAMGGFLFTILSALAALERELISERTRTALQHLKAQGKVYGKPAYGWTATEDGRLVEHPDEQKILLQAYKWKNEEWLGYKEICARLNEDGIPSKSGGIWHTSPLRRMLLEHKKRLAA
jgi:site-specific DNA recombinase